MLKHIANIIVTSVLLCSCVGQKPEVSINNGRLSMAFDAENGRLVSFRDLASGEEMIDTSSITGLPWHFMKGKTVLPDQAKLVDISKAGRRSLSLSWLTEDSISVRVKVRLDSKKSLSYWTAELESLSGKEVDKFVFPYVSGLKAKEDEKLVCAEWTGYLWSNLRGTISKEHPVKRYSCKTGMMNLLALYGEGSPDFYAASDDTDGNMKHFLVEVDSVSSRYSLENFILCGEDKYSIPYNAVLGTFEGDWLDAAKIYREWGIRQKWCKESRMRNALTASWAKDTDIWVWNRGSSDKVLSEAADLQDYLGGMHVSVLWHWWHNCLYDDTFPEYLPPREGEDKFKLAVAQAKERGINALVYMNAYQWGNNSESWTRENAEQFKALNYDGSGYSHIYNVFTGNALTPMCMATEFWRDKYASQAVEVINELGISGIYMDQLCNVYSCYNPEHGHSVGGGKYWIDGERLLMDKIRDLTKGKNVVLAGEGHSEPLFPYQDLCLTLQGSWKRYKYVPDMEIVPLFEAVYHDYATTFGSYTSLFYPPYDDKWPEEFRPENCEKMLPDKFNLQFRAELANTFIWGIQPMIANYHSNLRDLRPNEMEYLSRLVKTRSMATEYLAAGIMERSPKIETEEIEIDNSKVSLYAGRHGDMLTERKIKSPSLYCGTWKSQDGNLAVAVSNITDKSQPLKFIFDPSEYGMNGLYQVNIIDAEGHRTIEKSCRGTYSVDLDVKAADSQIVEFKALKQ